MRIHLLIFASTSLTITMAPKPLIEKSEKDRVAFEIDKKNENPEETEQDELSIPDLSPFDRVITNADLVSSILSK